MHVAPRCFGIGLLFFDMFVASLLVGSFCFILRALEGESTCFLRKELWCFCSQWTCLALEGVEIAGNLSLGDPLISIATYIPKVFILEFFGGKSLLALGTGFQPIVVDFVPIIPVVVFLDVVK